MASRSVVRAAEALNWAATGFGVEESWQLNILRGALGCTDLALSTMTLAGGTKIATGHRHPEGEEVYLLVAGRAEIKIEAEVFALAPFEAIRVRGEETRAVRALPGAEAIFVVASYPQDDPALTELVPDFWPAEPGEEAIHPEFRFNST